MKQHRKLSACITTCYFGLYVIIALSFLIRQPFGSPPDETNRYLIPQYIYEHGSLPNGFDEDVRIPGYGFSYAFQPILPYMLQSCAMKFTGMFTDSPQALLYAARSVNFLLGFFMAFLVLLLSRKWFCKERWQWLFAYLVTFMPQALFIHTYVNTDSCCMLSTALILYGLTCGLQDHFSVRSSVALSGGIILCALSYYNAYGYILSSILLFVSCFFRRAGKITFDLKNCLIKGSFIALLVLAGIGWWFVRSAILYDGDFLGLAARDYCASLYAAPAYHPATRLTWANCGYSVWDMLRRSDFLLLSQLSFFGIFGSMYIPTSIWVYRFYRLLFVTGIVSCIAVSFLNLPVFSRKTKIPGGPGGGFGGMFGGRKGLEGFFHANMVFCIITPLALSIRYSFFTDFQPQGRYLLPALIPLAYYCVRGIEKLTGLTGILLCKRFPCRDKWDTFEAAAAGTACVVIAVCLIVSVYGYVFPYYAAHPNG